MRDLDTSLSARILYTVFSDYYHESTENNNYCETRKIQHDFGKDLFGSQYSEAEWNNDLNFFAQCIKFFLSVPAPQIIPPPMGNVNLRNLLAKMTQVFKDWADAYFSMDPTSGKGDNVNEFIVKEAAMDDFARATKQNSWTTNKFTSSLRAYCQYYGYNFNPKTFQNAQSRISRKDGGKTKDMVYVQTQEIINPVDLHDDNVT